MEVKETVGMMNSVDYIATLEARAIMENIRL